MKSVLRILLGLLLVILPVQAGQQGTIVRQAPVFTQASSNTPHIGNLRAGTHVAMLERNGGWQEIYAQEQGITGWIRTFQVRQGDLSSTIIAADSEDSRGFLSGLAAFSRKASGFFSQDTEVTSSGTATIGVRGLSEMEINSATADYDELKKMKGYASKRKRMKKFTVAGNLKSSKVPYISGDKQ